MREKGKGMRKGYKRNGKSFPLIKNVVWLGTSKKIEIYYYYLIIIIIIIITNNNK